MHTLEKRKSQINKEDLSSLRALEKKSKINPKPVENKVRPEINEVENQSKEKRSMK